MCWKILRWWLSVTGWRFEEHYEIGLNYGRSWNLVWCYSIEVLPPRFVLRSWSSLILLWIGLLLLRISFGSEQYFSPPAKVGTNNSILRLNHYEILIHSDPASIATIWILLQDMAFLEEIDLDTEGNRYISIANQPIIDFHRQGANNEPFGAFIFPLPMNYLICRTSDDTSGQLKQIESLSVLIYICRSMLDGCSGVSDGMLEVAPTRRFNHVLSRWFLAIGHKFFFHNFRDILYWTESR